MRHKTIWAATFVMAFAVAVFAQKAPDFSGAWALDMSKSEMPQMGGGRGMGGGMGEMTVTIKQTADTLTIDQKMGEMSRTVTYKLDGTESTNQGMRGGEVKSTSKWDGDKLVTESTQTVNGPNGEMTVKSKEVRSLAADGTMVVETTRETPRGTNTSKLVFKKTT
ncbi:MAG: hypothetical protein ACM36C_11605 [Acidobacteriota bacterium]